MSDSRVLVIGLDGGTLSLVEPWAQDGKLPNLARLMSTSHYGPMASVMPVLSPSAWTSFMTGVNPGRHGIYDFVERQPNSYGKRLVHAGNIQAPALWEILSEQGKRSIVLNVPMTYPPRPINGIMVSGLGTPDYRPFATPDAVNERLQAAGYRVNKDVFYRPGQERPFIKAVNHFTDLHAGTALTFLQQEHWDLFMVVIRDTDEMAHFFWKHMDTGHPAHDPARDGPFQSALLDYYQRVDGWIGQLVQAAGPDTHVCLLSDHGMGPLYKDVFLNEWLRQEGYLVLKPAIGSGQPAGLLGRLGLTRANVSRTLHTLGLHRLERWLRHQLGERINLLPRDRRPEFVESVDWSRTRAYSFGYHGQVFINLQGREPQGVVSEQDYRPLVNEIMTRLQAWTDPDDGRPVVSAICPREQLFAGPHADRAPDIVLLMRDLAYITRHNYELGEQPGAVFAPPQTYESGSHREQGLLFMHMAGQTRGQRLPAGKASIVDVAPTLLALMGCPVPAGLDGRVLVDWLDTPPDVRYYQPALTGTPAAAELSSEDEAEVVERLKNLGYLG